MRSLGFTAFTLAVCWLPVSTVAQPVSLAGRVVDPHGAAVPGASVRLAREAGATSRVVAVGGDGAFRFEDLAPGLFLVDATAPGFRRRALAVAVPHEGALDVMLDVAGVDEQIVVTAAGVSQTASEISKALTTIDAREVLDRDETALAEIVRLTPGVQVTTDGGPGQLAQIRIRGLRPDAAAVLIDGLRLRDAATTQGDVSSFFSNLGFVDADRIEVLRGSGSSLYGTNAVGGVVNVVTREGGGPARPEAELEAGSLGWRKARAAVAGGAMDDRLAYSAGALWYDLAQGLDGNDAARSIGGQASLRYAPTPHASLTLRWFGSDDRAHLDASPTASGIPGGAIPKTTVVGAIAGATFFPQRDDPDDTRGSDFHSGALVFRHQPTAALGWQASVQRVHTDRVYRNGPAGAGFQPQGQDFGEYAGSIDTVDARGLLRPTPWLLATAGYEFEQERYRDHQDNNLAGVARVATSTRITQNASAGFAALELSLLERRLQVSLSGRLQGFDVSAPELAAIGVANPYASLPLASPPRALTGDASVAYTRAGGGTRLRTHAGNAYRAPSPYERFGGGFSADPVTGRVVFTAYGDPRLAPDRYRSYDAGVDQHLVGSRIVVSATAFTTRVLSITAFDSSGGVRPDTDPYGRALGYVNGSGGRSRGVEVGVESRPIAGLRATAAYTLTDATLDRDVTVPGFFRVLGVARHSASALATWRWSGRGDATADLVAASESFAAYFAAGQARAFRFPGFAKVAIVAGYRVSGGDERPLRVYLKVDNLLDQTYYQSGWRALGRTFVGGMSFGR